MLEEISDDTIKALRILLVRLFRSNGTLIVLADASRQLRRPKKYPDVVSNYEWCPLPVGIRNESGETINVKTNDFASYLAKFTKWSFYFTGMRYTREFADICGADHENRYLFPVERWATNRENRVLAGKYSCHQFPRKHSAGHYGGGHYYYDDKPDEIFGSMVCLPLVPAVDSREAVNLVLEGVLGLPQTTVPPAWVIQLELPGVPALQAQVRQNVEKIESIRGQIEALQDQITDIEDYKKILYGSGPELETVFRRALEQMGGKVARAKYSREEYILEWRGEEYLIEVKGIGKSVALEHVRQLMDYMLKYQGDTGKLCKGILFGNSWRHLPPQERDTRDTPCFPDNVQKFAASHNISLISSLVFFGALSRFLAGELSGVHILDSMTSGIGRVENLEEKK